MMEGKAGKWGWGNRKEEGIASLNYANVCRTRRMTPNNKQGREKGRKKKKKRRWKSTGRGMGESASRSHVPPSKSCHFHVTRCHNQSLSVQLRPVAAGHQSVFPVSATSSCRHGNCVPHLVALVLVVVAVTADKLVQRGEEGGWEERP